MKVAKHYLWLALIAGPLIMIAPVLLTGKAIYWGTPFLQFVPWQVIGYRLLQNGLPYWNPFLGMGAPLIANYQSAWFYPPNWILLVLQALGGVGWLAWGQGLVILLHWWLSALGTALLLRRLGINSVGQAVGGLAFALSGYLVGRAGFLSMNAATAWLPWVTLAADYFAVNNQTRQGWRQNLIRTIALTSAIGMMLLSGHAQLSWYILMFSFAWLVTRAYLSGGLTQVGKSTLWYCLAGLLGAGIAAIQLLPTLEYLRLSSRAESLDYAFTVNYSFYPWRLLGFIAPDLFGNPANGNYWLNSYIFEDAVYIGLLPLILAGSALLHLLPSRRKKQQQLEGFPTGIIWFLGGMILFSMIIAMGQFLPVFQFFYRYIPTFNMFQAPARFSLLAVFSLALLAGAGFQYWHKPGGKALYWTRLFTAGGAAIAIGSGLAWVFLGEVRPTFVQAAALVGVWCVGAGVLSLTRPDESKANKLPVWNAALISWIILDLCVAGWSLNPPASRSLFTTAQTEAIQLSNIVLSHRIYMPPEVETHLKFEEMFAVDVYPDRADLQKLPADLIPNSNLFAVLFSANNFDPLTTARYKRWMDMLGRLPADQRNGWLRMMDVSMRAELLPESNTVEWKQVSSPGYYRFTDCAIKVKDEEEAFSAVLKRGPGTQEDSLIPVPVIIEGIDQGNDTACTTGPLAEIIDPVRTPTEHKINVHAQRDIYLVEAESWYPGWKAELDGEPIALERADYLFRAVKIPEGDHIVRIYYESETASLGRTITLLVSLVIIIAYVLLKYFRRGYKLDANVNADL